MVPSSDTLEITKRLDALEARFDGFEALLANVTRRANGRTHDPRFLPLDEAAAMLGLKGKNPTGAIRKRIERARAAGMRIRSRHGAVHRLDFAAYIEKLEG
jgi:hypothetical protein